MPQTLPQPSCHVCGSGPSSNLLLAQPRLPCRGTAASRHMISRAFRGAKLLAPLLSPEQPSQQSPEQQQQQPQQLQGSDAPVAKALSLLSWVGSGDKQPATEPAQEQQQEQPAKQDTASPSDYSALMFVSLLWGSYAPVLRYLYSMDDLLTPQVLTAHRTVISAAALIIASGAMFAVDRYKQHQRLQQQLREEQLQREREEQARKQWLRILPALLLNMLAPFGSSSTTTSSRGHSSKQQPLFPLLFRPGTSSTSSSTGSGAAWPLLQWLPRLPGVTQDDSSTSSPSSSSSSSTSSTSSSSAAPMSAVLLAGLELGTWNFLATAAQACGLNLSTATKAAFLTQTTAVFTPCLAMLCGQAVLPAHWVACLAALMGSLCISVDSMGVQGMNSDSSPAAVISSTERQQQEVVGTLQQAAAASPVDEMLDAPPVLTATAVEPAAAAALAVQEATGITSSEQYDSFQSAKSQPSAVVPSPIADEGLHNSIGDSAQTDSPAVLAFSDQAADVLQQGQQEELPAAVAAHAADSSAQQGSSLQLELLLQQQEQQEQQEQQAVAAGSGQDISSSQLPQQEALGSMAVPSGCPGDSLECSAVRLQQYQQQLGQRAVGEEDATAAAFADAFGLPREGSSSDSVERSELGLDLQGLQGVSSSSADAEQQSGLQAWQQEVQQELQQVQSLVVQNTAPSSSADSSTWGISGEVYILLACCCYAIATVRLSMLAPGLDPVQLATSKTLTLAAASLVWLLAFETGAEFAAEAAGSASAVGAAVGAADSAAAATAAAGMTAAGVLDQAVAAVQSAWASWQLPPAFDHGQGKLLLFYSALGPGALATVLQTKGQGTVAAAQAQVFYSLTPVWAALLANTCLQGEEMGPLAWVGGGIIIAASIGAAISGSRGSSSSDGSTEA